MIVIEDLQKTYSNCVALNDISMSIKSGEFLAIVGRSGSGKSTLLNMIGLLDKPTSGGIYIDDVDVAILNDKSKASMRLNTIGHIFQSFQLEPSYSVYKNVEIPLLIANVKKKEREERVKKAIADVGLESKLKAKANTLSGGEQQRVCIARALVNNPKIIIADEPCGNLDVANSGVIMGILRGLAEKGITVVLVTHDLEDAKIADRIIEIEDGKIKSEQYA